jgi:DNA-binding response OmpR family regulator
VVLAHSDLGFAALASRQLRRLGWDVYLAASGAEARSLTSTLQPSAVILQTDLPDESGWLLSEKLTRAEPTLKVLLVADRETPEQASFASFVGAAALLQRRDGVAPLIEEMGGAAIPTAN